MSKKNWEYVPEGESGEDKITSKEVEKIVERKLEESVENVRKHRLKKEEDVPSVKCKACGAVVSGELWKEYGECPICLDHKRDRERKKIRAKIEAKKKAEETLRKKREEQEEIIRGWKNFGWFAGFVSAVVWVIKKYRG